MCRMHGFGTANAVLTSQHDSSMRFRMRSAPSQSARKSDPPSKGLSAVCFCAASPTPCSMWPIQAKLWSSHVFMVLGIREFGGGGAPANKPLQLTAAGSGGTPSVIADRARA